MILTIDIGNSNIVLGGVRDQEIVFEARLRTEATKTSDQYCVDLKILMEVYGVSNQDIEEAMSHNPLAKHESLSEQDQNKEDS